jgi:hypothetical protein
VTQSWSISPDHEAEHLFEQLADSFLADPTVSRGPGSALFAGLVGGKAFAMLVRANSS